MGKWLVVILGPTGVGKTDLSIRLANDFDTAIVSCDSRQVYKEMHIGTAVPSREQLAAVPHFFIQTIPVESYYNCWQFEQQALQQITTLFGSRDVVVMAGGSMMYIDAVCHGMDSIPDVDPGVRQSVTRMYREEGLDSIRLLLKRLDPDFYEEVDLKNTKRVMHAVEICLTTGRPYSSQRSGIKKNRDFSILKVGLNREREELYDRINDRVDQMITRGLEAEARSLYAFRHLNSLNTVGYKEFFDYFDGKTDREEAIRLLKRNTRHYAKKQLSWFRRDDEIHWFHPADEQQVLQFVKKACGIKA